MLVPRRGLANLVFMRVFTIYGGFLGGVKSGTVAKPSLKPTLVGVSGLLALVMSLELFCHFTFPVDSLPTRRLPWPETTVCHH